MVQYSRSIRISIMCFGIISICLIIFTNAAYTHVVDILNNKCTPDTYVVVSCNVCQCNSNGQIDEEHCTKNNCEKGHVDIRRFNDQEMCQPNTWYSFAPCQYCYCLNKNKLLCNYIRDREEILKMGKHNLTVCGKNLIKEVLTLVPEDLNPLQDKVYEGVPNNNNINNLPVQNAQAVEYEGGIDHKPFLGLQLNDFNVDNNNETDYYSDTDMEQKAEINNVDNKYKANPYREGEIATSYETVEDNNGIDNQPNDINKLYFPAITPKQKSDDVTLSPIVSPIGPATQNPVQRLSRHKFPVYNIGKALENILDKVLHLRRSKVTVRKNTDCVPGTTKNIKCNTCFCLKSGKMVCTDNPCH